MYDQDFAVRLFFLGRNGNQVSQTVFRSVVVPRRVTLLTTENGTMLPA